VRTLICLVALASASQVMAQEPSEDGPQAVFTATLLDSMIGEWDSVGTTMGKPVSHLVHLR